MNQDDDSDSSEESEEEQQRSTEFRYFDLPKIQQKHVQPVNTQLEFMNAELSWKRKLRENPPADLPLPQSLAPDIQTLMDRIGPGRADIHGELLHSSVAVKAYEEAAASEFVSSVQKGDDKVLHTNYMERATASFTGGPQLPPTFLQQLINDMNYSKNRNVVIMTQKRSFIRPKQTQPLREYVCFVNYNADTLKGFFQYPFAKTYNEVKDHQTARTGSEADPAAALNLFYEVYVNNQKTALQTADRKLLEGPLRLANDNTPLQTLQSLGYVNNMSDNPGLNRDILDSLATSFERMCKKLNDRDGFYKDVPGAVKRSFWQPPTNLNEMVVRRDNHSSDAYYLIPNSEVAAVETPRWGKQAGWVKAALTPNPDDKPRSYEDPSALYDNDVMRERFPSVHGQIKAHLARSMIPLDSYRAMIDILPKKYADKERFYNRLFPDILGALSPASRRLPGISGILMFMGEDDEREDPHGGDEEGLPEKEKEEDEDLLYGYVREDPEQPSFLMSTTKFKEDDKGNFVTDYPEIMKPFLTAYQKGYMDAWEHLEGYDYQFNYGEDNLYYPDTEYFKTKREFKFADDSYSSNARDLSRWMQDMEIMGVIRDPINNAIVYLIDMETQTPLLNLVRRVYEGVFDPSQEIRENKETIATILTILMLSTPWHYYNIREYPYLEWIREHFTNEPRCFLLRGTVIMALLVLERRIFQIMKKPKKHWGALRVLRWRMQSQNIMRALLLTDTHYLLRTNPPLPRLIISEWVDSVRMLQRELIAYIYGALMVSTKFFVNGTLRRSQITDINRMIQEGYLPYSCLTWITSRVNIILQDIVAAYRASFSKKRDKPTESDDDDDYDEETGERPQKRTKIRDADLRFLVAMFRKIAVKKE